MKRTEMSPAEVVIKELGIPTIADALGVNRSTIHRWRYPRPRGSGGRVPSWYHPDLLQLAQREGRTLSAEDLVLGRSRAA